MTVAELLDHFHRYPDAIEFFDRTENVEDTIYLKLSELKYDKGAYNDFVSEYGEREVEDWEYRQEDTLYIKFGDDFWND